MLKNVVSLIIIFIVRLDYSGSEEFLFISPFEVYFSKNIPLKLGPSYVAMCEDFIELECILREKVFHVEKLILIKNRF
ncbi:hypothetical protein AQUCO_03800131v1 [Aquilegia coerulea]|uniref:Uncharacterized protein n=1 Tax=Aquilegia coerulea TaxID=218851 RepID=A0A2G5CSQ5_AQUCA|nr:hypothetical protein AQUCO_03800131v1 [Aquilegia coerulea]